MERFITTLHRVQGNKYLSASGTTLLVYDYFQTLELEVAFIWKAKWDAGKIAYLFARYPAFLYVSLLVYYLSSTNITPQACHKVFSVVHLNGAVVIAAAEVILILRTIALSGNNKWLKTSLIVTFMGVTISAFIIIALILSSVRYIKSPIPALRACLPVEDSSIGYIGFALILAFEALLMFITIVLGIRRFRNAQSPLVKSLYSNGILSFSYIVSISLVNIIIQFTGPLELIDSLATLQIVLHSLLSCRILLYVRRDGSPRSYRHDYELEQVSAIQFRSDTRRVLSFQSIPHPESRSSLQ